MLPRKRIATVNVAHPGGKKMFFKKLILNKCASDAIQIQIIYRIELKKIKKPNNVSSRKGYRENEIIPSNANEIRFPYENLDFPQYLFPTSYNTSLLLNPIHFTRPLKNL